MSWPIVKLSDVAELINGDRSSNYPSGEDIVNKGILFLSTKNIVANKIDINESNYITKEKFSSLARGKLRKKDLIITLRGTLGSCCIFDTEFDTGFINAQMMIIRCNDEISNKYLHYYLTSLAVNFEFQRANTGSAVPQLTGRQLAEFKIPLPELAEQKRIASILDKADSICRKRQQAITLADEFLRSVFLDIFGDPMLNPKGWKVKPWSEVLKIINGKNQKAVLSPDGQYPIMGSGGEMGRANDYLSPENSIIIGRKGNINKPILVKENYWNVDTAFGLVPDENQLSFNYLYWFCIFFDFERLNKTVTIPSLTKSDLLEIKIPVPDMDKQKEFDAIVNKLSVMNREYSQFARSANEAFNSLSQKAFSGQL